MPQAEPLKIAPGFIEKVMGYKDRPWALIRDAVADLRVQGKRDGHDIEMDVWIQLFPVVDDRGDGSKDPNGVDGYYCEQCLAGAWLLRESAIVVTDLWDRPVWCDWQHPECREAWPRSLCDEVAAVAPDSDRSSVSGFLDRLMRALDFFRRGEVRSGLERVCPDRDVMLWREVPPDLGEWFYPGDYFADPDRFCDRLLALADCLEEHLPSFFETGNWSGPDFSQDQDPEQAQEN